MARGWGLSPCRPQRHSQRQYVLGDAPAYGTICREEPVFAGKVICGVRNETSGQSWRSNTVATDPFTGQNRNSKCSSSIQHKRLGGWRPKTLYLRSVSENSVVGQFDPIYKADERSRTYHKGRM